MKNRCSSSLNPEEYPAVWISEPSCFSDHRTPQPDIFANKPFGLHKVDSLLWDRFSKAVGEHMSRLNYHGTALLYFRIMTILLAVTPAFVRFVLCQNDLEELGKHKDILLFFQVSTLLLVLSTIPVSCRMIHKNQKIDKAIESTCICYEPEFQSRGFSLVYKTKWTGTCKPRHTRASRVILFIPYNDQGEIC